MEIPRAVQLISPETRLTAVHMLAEHQNWNAARQNEAAAHSLSPSALIYKDKMQQLIFNASTNPRLKDCANIAFMSNRELSRGTVIEDIERERHMHETRFQNMLQEKYELATRSTKTTMRCRRCGGTDIFAEQKQTRGADEAMTVFCTCSRCSLRWTMR